MGDDGKPGGSKLDRTENGTAGERCRDSRINKLSRAKAHPVYTQERGAAPIKFNSATESRLTSRGTIKRTVMPLIHKIVNLTNVHAQIPSGDYRLTD